MSTKDTKAESTTDSGKRLSLRREVVRELEVRTGVKTGLACKYTGGICEKTCCSPAAQPTRLATLI